MNINNEVTCRICLEGNAVNNIFTSKRTHNSSKVSCQDMMHELFSFSATRDDGLPPNICRRCFTKLLSAYKLKDLAEKSYKTLTGHFLRHNFPYKAEGDGEGDIKLELHIKEEPDERLVLLEERLHAASDSGEEDGDQDDLPLAFDQQLVSSMEDDAEMETSTTKKRGPKRKEKTETKKELSVCEQCGARVANLREHVKSHDEQRLRMPCGDCSRSFCSAAARKRHRSVHHLGLRYHCEICNKKYKRGYEHVRTMHSGLPRRFPCPVCSRAFLTAATLKFHLTSHTKERPFSCPDCGKGFRSKAFCVYHRRRVHEKERKNICQYCSKGFFSAHHLNVHLRSHTKEKNYKCKECGKMFSTNSAVKNHELRHSGLKGAPCPLCDMAFINNGALKTHMLSHTKEKKHECKYCGVKFGRTDHRNRHQKTAHENRLPSIE